jgi:hypothetical protein
MNLSDFSTLAEAKVYATITGKLIHRDSLNGWLGQAGIYKRMKAIAADTSNPFCDVLDAFLDSVEYNFIAGKTTGDAHIALLDSLIANEPTIGPQLAALRPVVLSRANVVSYPFENATRHAFEVAKGITNKTAVIVEQGYCTIQTTADCVAHRPQIYKEVTFVNGDVEYIRVAGFNTVELAGLYRVQCPSFPNMYIDNTYSVITQG